MSQDVWDLRQQVAASGYIWRTARPARDGATIKLARADWRKQFQDPQPVLAESDASAGLYRVYDPFETPTLFRLFSQLPLSSSEECQTGILQFASQYGPLGVWRSLLPETGQKWGLRLLPEGEPYQAWFTAIRDMALAVKVWDLLVGNDPAAFAPLFHWHSGFWTMDCEWVGSRIESTEIVLREDDPRPAARLWLQRQINQGMHGQVHPMVLLDLTRGSQVLRLFSSSLLAIMYLQFARAIAEGAWHRACVVCGTWFPVEPGVDARKARRKFCSAACKVADYRQRREQALALQAEGVPPRVIAERIDTDLATIREWLKKEGK